MDARLRHLLASVGGSGSGMGSTPTDTPQVDSSEQLYISSLALLKMLKHGVRDIEELCRQPPVFAMRRSCWGTHGSDGSHARRVCG